MSQDPPNPDSDDSQPKLRRPIRLTPFGLFLVGMMLVMLLVSLIGQFQNDKSTIENFSWFESQIDRGNVAYVEIGPSEASGTFREAPEAPQRFDRATGKLKAPTDSDGKPAKLKLQFKLNLPSGDSRAKDDLIERLKQKQVAFSIKQAPEDMTWFVYLLMMFFSAALFVMVWSQFRKMRDQMSGGGFLSGFNRSPAKRYEGAKQPITFKDVAGLEGVKADLLEIVDFLKSPERFQKLGGRIPKGVLLNGPPGTGKTLLARAVAGEAGVPFFSVNGSEFIQMFVGVGASRVRDLFKTAKESAPAIIFIDEIDAVGRQRGAGLGGGHDEREQTLNQILGEMDGFSQTEAVIVVAATNRPDVLDPALLRPGRFDRHVTVGRPTLKGRLEIFKVHVRDVPLAENVNLELLAASTIGLTGADIRNIVNEAALWAARNNKTSVEHSDFDYARDKVLIGAKREEVLQEKEKEKTAYHEAGHTLAAWLLPNAQRVHKVTIIPRGRTLGVTQLIPTEDRMNTAESELRDHLVMALGGRAAEKLVYNETTVGAENDLERATGLARHMVTHWGMSERLGPVSYKTSDDDPFLGREMHRQRQFSEHTMELIDDEVAKLLRTSDEQALALLTQHRDKLELLVRALLEKEELDEKEIAAVIGTAKQASN